MPVFTYKGYDVKTGEKRQGRIDADSKKTAKSRLRQRDKVIVVDINEETPASTKAKKPMLALGTSVSVSDVAVMTRQFATLQKAHVPLDESLKALSAQVEKDELRKTLSSLKDQISEGKSLGEAVSKFPKIFSKLYINMIKAGEQSGTLGVVLARLADFLEYQVAIRGQVLSALAYPGVMIGSSLLIVIYLFVSVVPKMQKVFLSLKVKLPWYTDLLIKMSEGMQQHWFIIILIVGAMIYLANRWVNTEKGRLRYDSWALNAPVLGGIVLRINTSKFTRTLSTLLSSGVPIIQALEITRNIIGNRILSDIVEKAKIGVQEGLNLGDCLARDDIFPQLVIHMIKTGEKTGQLEEMLNHVAEAYDAEVERKISGMISIIEPFMIMVMAGIVTVIIIALLMPMLTIMNQMR